MESFEAAQAKSDALPVVIGISIEEEDLDDLIPEPKSPRVGSLVDHFSYGSSGSPGSYSRSSSTGSMRLNKTIEMFLHSLVGNIW